MATDLAPGSTARGPRAAVVGHVASFLLACPAAYLAVRDPDRRLAWGAVLAVLAAVFAGCAAAIGRAGAADDPKAWPRVGLVSTAFAGLVVAAASFALGGPRQAGLRAIGVGLAGAALLGAYRLDPRRFRGAAGAFVWVGPAVLLAWALLDGTSALVAMSLR